ncbi:mechanosensitive ion channel family protein [Burkholderia gladioli]|uniref:mechanosensitive ion channel family protein n=1 Tax=Burkholderia gladioli TaxID=28095 RepID=UPI003FA58F68
MNAIWFAPLVGCLILLAASCAIALAVRFVLFRVVAKFAARTPTRFDDVLFQFGAFKWLSRLVPFVVFQLGFRSIPNIPESAAQIVDKLLFAIVVFLVAMTIGAVLSAAEHLHRTQPRERPTLSLKGAMQLIKLVMYITAALVVIGTITGKQIGLLLSGIGAMSAVLMLIFKDTILGLVAGVQLSSNDMLRIGDWITMPSAGADGDVIDITLNTVKVANFDRTIITIPTWKLITESYQNWRGMTESGGRRIKRALFIDASSVRFLSPEEIARLERFTLLKDYLAGKRDTLAEWNGALGADGEWMGNRRQLTNLGTFRAYCDSYLQRHPRIHRGMTRMARQLPLTAEGIPMELYCFTDTTTWLDYETIQGDIFDHLLAVLPEFGLRVYQHPSGFDMRGMMEAAVASRREAESAAAAGAARAAKPAASLMQADGAAKAADAPRAADAEPAGTR